MKTTTVFILFSAILVMVSAAYLTTAHAESGPDRNGDDIRYIYHDVIVPEGDEEIFQGETIDLTGNIHVHGTLILQNVTILMNSTYNGECGIIVHPGGDLRIIENSRIEPAGEKHFTFIVSRENKEYGNLVITDSTVSGAGYHSTIREHRGIFIESAKVTISRSEFTGDHIALYFYHVRGDVLVEDSRFIGNEQAILMDSSSGFTLESNEFIDNAEATRITRSDVITLNGNSYRENDHAIQMDNSTEFVITDNTIDGNSLSGINIESSFDGIIEDNVVKDTHSSDRGMMGAGIILRSNSQVSVSGNEIDDNDIGIMLILNNTGSSIRDTNIRGGRLGLLLYNEHYTNTYEGLSIQDTREAAVNIKHSSSQVFDNLSFTANEGLELNITAASALFNFPRLEVLDHSVDLKSEVILMSQTMIRTTELSGVSLEGSQVSISVDGAVIYATPGYETSSGIQGDDPTTDVMGMTGPIPLEYIIMDSRGTHECRIDIEVSWKGLELTRTIYGLINEIEWFNFNIPDLTVSNNEMVIIPSESYEPGDPRDDDVLLVGTTITNLGTADMETDVSVYRVPGIWTGAIDVPVSEFGIPFNADLIETSTVSVDALETKQIQVGWAPGTAGEHTLISIIDPSDRELELRKDNNIAYIHVTVRGSEVNPLEYAEISLTIPGLENTSEINTTLLNLMPIIRNHGSLRGQVILQATLHQEGQTLSIFRDVYSVEAGEEVRVQLPVDLVLGEAVLNISLMQQIGEESLRVLTPFLSFSFIVEEGKGPGFEPRNENEPLIPGVILYSSVAGTISFFVAYVAFAESARYRFLMFFVPLYMRMSKKDITEHYTRGEILGYIKQNPGESYNNIKRDLEMSNGKLAYHLSVLEKGKFVKSVTDGMYRRYYPRMMKVTTYGRITSVQEEILRRIEETPGITQKDLSKLVDLSTATINYHVRKLTGKGLIKTKRTGIFIHYYLDDLTVEEIMANAISSSRRATVKQ